MVQRSKLGVVVKTLFIILTPTGNKRSLTMIVGSLGPIIDKGGTRRWLD
jgi:hypothetical protein